MQQKQIFVERSMQYLSPHEKQATVPADCKPFIPDIASNPHALAHTLKRKGGRMGGDGVGGGGGNLSRYRSFQHLLLLHLSGGPKERSWRCFQTASAPLLTKACSRRFTRLACRMSSISRGRKIERSKSSDKQSNDDAGAELDVSMGYQWIRHSFGYCYVIEHKSARSIVKNFAN